MKYIKNTEKPLQKFRFFSQIFFSLICIWIGIDFYFFIQYLESGGTIAFSERPPGAEAFLPISSMMSLYYYFQTGNIHFAHPAGLFIFVAIIIVSFVFGKSFCSWICPIGFISELIGDFSYKFQKKVLKIKKAFALPRFLDYPLRMLKYLLLAFFIYSIFFLMSPEALLGFLNSPYNLVSDIKMYYFFADISRLALIIICALFVLSIFIRNFWCRFLCPYGALFGLLSLLSPQKIKRKTNTCIDCSLCAKACPSSIKVDKVKTVFSDECTSCMNCVDACPVKDTLEVKSFIIRKTIPKKAVFFVILILFFAILAAGYFSGNWQNKITKEEYLELFENIEYYGHPTSTTGIKEFNETYNGGDVYEK